MFAPMEALWGSPFKPHVRNKHRACQIRIVEKSFVLIWFLFLRVDLRAISLFPVPHDVVEFIRTGHGLSSSLVFYFWIQEF